MTMRGRLTRADADEVEAELRRLEMDHLVTKRQLRLFMQSCMPCGHAVGNLLTCPDPPYGCVICGEAGELTKPDPKLDVVLREDVQKTPG